MDIEEYKKSMPRCKDCTGFGCGECKTAGENEVACKDFERKPKLTNGDKIRAMTDEELRNFILDLVAPCNVCANDRCDEDETCEIGVSKWLKQEVSEDAGSKTD